MLVIQHIWSRWRKEARSADARRWRGRPAYRLPGPLPEPSPGSSAHVVVHRIEPVDPTGSEIIETFQNADGNMVANMRWVTSGETFDLSLSRPFSTMLTTDWPTHLPSPLITLQPGQSTVVDWNGRFHAAMASQKGYFFEAHRIAAACVDDPAPDLFLKLEPRKTFDFTTRIY